MKQMTNKAKDRSVFLAVVLVMTLAMVMMLQAAPAFAADENTEENITVEINVGEHGSVNGHTDDYTETVSSGADLVLSCQADEGFVIGTILVNETELEAEDVEGIAGQASGELTLEELSEDLTVAVNFTETADDGGGTEDDPAAGGTDPGEAGGETGGDEGIDPGNTGGETGGDEGVDPGDAGGDEGSDPTGTDPAAADPSDAEQPDPGSGDEEVSEPEPSAGDDSTADPATGETKDDPAADAGKDGKGSDTATDSGMPDSSVYKTDSTPKTGDSFPTTVILLLMTSLSGLGGLGVRHLLKLQSGVSA